MRAGGWTHTKGWSRKILVEGERGVDEEIREKGDKERRREGEMVRVQR